MVALHSALYTTLLVLCGGLSLWALVVMGLGRAIDGAFRSTYLLMVATTVVQAVVGLLMFFDGLRPVQSFHYLYGVSLMVFSGAGYVLASRGPARREALVLGIAAAACVGLIWRAAITAHGG